MFQKNKLDKLRRSKEKKPGQYPVVWATQDQTSHKHDLYRPLVTIAAKQKQDGKRQARPTFLAAVVTTLGEYGQGMFKLQEFILKTYSRKLNMEGDRADGRTAKELTAEFRTRFRNATQVAVARGLA